LADQGFPLPAEPLHRRHRCADLDDAVRREEVAALHGQRGGLVLVPARPTQYLDRRGTSLLPPANPRDRRRSPDRRRKQYAVPFPDRRLTRSAYEQVFLKLVSGGRLRVGDEMYRPIGMKGWYHAIFRRESDGAERLLSIDQLLLKMEDWT
jgi:hypothetical protein